MSADLALYAVNNTERNADLIREWYDPENDFLDSDTYERLANDLFGWGWGGQDYRDVPRCWIGQVSWMKAGLMEDFKLWVPATVYDIHRKVAGAGESGGLLLDEGVYGVLMAAMNKKNESHYAEVWWESFDPEKMSGSYCTVRSFKIGGKNIRYRKSESRGMAKRQNVKKFLRANMGKLLVEVSE
jgi:hypothetical protein